MAKSSSKGMESLMALAGKKGPAKAKNSVPTIDAPESLRPHIADWIEAKRMEKTAEANRKAAESAMNETVSRLRIDRCRKDHELHPSIALNGGSSGSIKAVQVSRCLKMSTDEHQDALLDTFGDVDFSRFFKTQTVYNIDAEKLSELPDGDKIAAKIAAALGEHAKDVLTVESVIRPTEEYFNASVLDPKVSTKAEAAAADGHAVLFSPSYRQ